MKISIQIVGLGGRAVSGPKAVFDEQGGSVGRRSDNTLVIPDQTRRVSRIHMAVFHQGGQFRVRDQGSFLPVYVNGHGVGFQRDMTIRPGDKIQMGPYTLAVAGADGLAAGTAPAPVPVPDIAARAAPDAAGEGAAAGSATAGEETGSIPFELVQERLAAAKAAGLRLTTDSYPIPPKVAALTEESFDAAATQDSPIAPPEALDPSRPDDVAAETGGIAGEELSSTIDLEPVGSRLVRAETGAFPTLETVRKAGEAPAPTQSDAPLPTPPVSQQRSAPRVMSLLQTARRVLGGKR
ncbi:MAG: FHA domain-containing protein [Betaproteobacteria bacterium]|nr:FHA domain-containing protein [Betaproteobacteria bacterium]